MKKNKECILYLVIIFTISLSSCGDRQNQTDNLYQSSNPEEFQKIEMKLGNKIYEVSLNYKVNEQSKKERKFVNIRTSHLFNIGSLKDTIFYGATLLITDKSGNIYVLDMLDASVKKFDRNGLFIKKYGRKGRGPGEFMSPFRIDVTDDDKLLVLDPNLNKCELFEGGKIKQFIMSSMPTGACFVDSMSFVTFQMIDPFDYSAIKKYNIVNNSSVECQNLILNNTDLNLGPLAFLNGDIYRIDKNSFLYVPEFMNHFVKYSNEGKIIYARKTIENIKLLSIQRDNPKMASFRLPNEYISSWRAFVVNNKLYNVSYQAMKKKANSRDYVIDVYSLSDGEYLYSFKLLDQEKMMNIYMDKERLYLLKVTMELEVLSYKIDE